MKTLVTSERVKEVLAEAIPRALKDRGLTMREVARRVNTTPQTISNICNGRHEPGLSLVLSLDEELGLDLPGIFDQVRKSPSNRRAAIAESRKRL
jgi:transcriptional regulator with XRE-family HTH domain